ncbi:C40 family peptidase [Aquibacillus saliphilus]|uniref:C40 family peptidase n=1 Tax=Aquibacillus saliphilus TaxID=1909422 RepID=UPI001CF06839|nr:LysM peptidoglycan-binding domain-containing protein [Aquibacillus saliphilus]
MKKTLLSLTAGAVIASSFAAGSAEAATYKVQKGDSLWLIAQKHKTSVNNLRTINNLNSAIIFPNQLLKIDLETAPTKPPVKSEQVKNEVTTYKVKAGDSLSKIAAAHQISLTNLMEWNKLTTTLIYPGDVFAVTKPSSSSTNEKPAPTKKPSDSGSSNDSSSSTPTSTYKVKAGDSLWKIGNNQGVSISDLKKWNNLSSDVIHIGQTLQLKKAAPEKVEQPKVEQQPTEQVDYNITKLLNEANKLLGTAYLFGGSSLSTGFDCSGFIHYVYNKAGKSIGRYSSDGYYNRSFYVNKPQVGDLVFFENTYRKGISHLGILVGDNKFIHAASGGVQVTSLDNSYWKKHFEGFKRLY